MSLGWGLRGFIGGGPLGAMIPGAMVGLALCLLLGRPAGSSALVAALAAVGVGFGGQMTYGNTIQLAVAESTRAWGLLGLTAKGAVWGLLGGAVIGLALERGRVSCAGLGAMIAGTWVGWHFLNVPRLVYFSIDRQEVWAGLLLGALALLVVERSAMAWRFALAAAVGGGFGFGFGGWLQVWGRWNAPHAWVGWWKVMEFTFGFFFGLALAWAAERWRAPERGVDLHDGVAGRLAATVVIVGALLAEYNWPFRFGYTIVGAALLAMLAWRPATAQLVALVMTTSAFCYDIVRDWRILPVVATLQLPELAWLNTPLRMLLALTWSANLVATIKALTRGEFHGEHAMFLVLGIIITWQSRQAAAQRLPKRV